MSPLPASRADIPQESCYLLNHDPFRHPWPPSHRRPSTCVAGTAASTRSATTLLASDIRSIDLHGVDIPRAADEVCSMPTTFVSTTRRSLTRPAATAVSIMGAYAVLAACQGRTRWLHD